MVEKETEAKVYTEEQYKAVADDLAKCKAAYDELVSAFNRLLKEYNDLHVATLFSKQ